MEKMDALTGILTRRSIRRYTEQTISDEEITAILRAGMHGPSAGNAQPWHFMVVRDRSHLNEIALKHPFAKMLFHTTVAIVVCADTAHEKYPGNWVLDCSAASQNILLAAHALGIGSVWVGIYPEQDRMELLKTVLSLPENIQPLSLIPIGYPAETRHPEDRYHPERIHYDVW